MIWALVVVVILLGNVCLGQYLRIRDLEEALDAMEEDASRRRRNARAALGLE